MLKTPLAGCHEALGARMTDFNGWYLPIQYDGIIAEHHRTRKQCTIFDTCHMGRFQLTGRDSLANMGRLLTMDTVSMADGQCRYGFMLNDDAGVIDDLVVYRFSTDKWWLIVNAGTRLNDFAWMHERLSGDAILTDLTTELAKVDVQGPGSPTIVSQVLRQDVSALPRFRFAPCLWAGKSAVVSRTGYTGETGFEVYTGTADAVALWNAFVQAGAAPAGLGARDTLRLEAALPLYGHELSEGVTPFDAGLMRFVTNTREFVGRAALEKRVAAGARTLLAGFSIDGRRSARSGDRIVIGGREAGHVTSGSFSPTLEQGIGLAYMDPALTKAGQSFNVLTGRGELSAGIVPTPFYRRAGK